MTLYQCGPASHAGCGKTFSFDEGPEGLFAPRHCPHCGAVFCGDECCGNMAIEVEAMRTDDPGEAYYSNGYRCKRCGSAELSYTRLGCCVIATTCRTCGHER